MFDIVIYIVYSLSLPEGKKIISLEKTVQLKGKCEW